MIALTQEKREELIADCEFDIKRLTSLVDDFPEETALRSILLRQKLALSALTAIPAGSFHIYEQKVDATTDYVSDGEWPIDEGELLVYTAPPVREVKFPDKAKINELGEGMEYFCLGWNNCLEEVKSLNGLGD